MDENTLWKAFEASGKIEDYLAYNSIVQNRYNSVDSLVGSTNANKNAGSYNKTTEYR